MEAVLRVNGAIILSKIELTIFLVHEFGCESV